MFSTDPAADRAFLTDLLAWPSVSDPVSTAQAGEEWLIFGTPLSELGVHPARDAGGASSAAPGRTPGSPSGALLGLYEASHTVAYDLRP